MKSKQKMRMIAVMLILMMSLMSLAGCSMNDTGYAALMLERANLNAFSIAGDFSAEINKDGFYSYSGDSEMVKMQANVSGNVMLSEDDFYFDLVVKYGIDDPKMSSEVNLILSDGALWVPVKDYITITTTSLKYNDELSDQMCEKIKAALEKEYAGYDYVKLSSGMDSAEDAFYVSGTYLPYGVGSSYALDKEIRELVIKAISETFKNLESGMTSRTSNGVTLEITPEKAYALYDNLIKYLKDNKKAVFQGMVKLNEDLKKISPDYAIDYMVADEQGFYDFVDEAVQSQSESSDYEKEMAKLTFKGSYFKDSVTKSGSAYTSDLDGKLVYQGTQVASVKAKVKQTAATNVEKKVVSAKNAISIADIGVRTDAIVKKINHATVMSISWYNSDRMYEDYSVQADIELVEGFDWDYMEYCNEGGSMFLPMRTICEWFGEDVAWDNATKKAYVVRGDQKTEMTGKLVYKTTYVKIRDFEKLGYTVDYAYDKEYGEHYVTMTKK